MGEAAQASAVVEFSDYDAMIEALRARAAELGLAYAQIDEIAGWASGYTGKLLGPAQIKTMTVLRQIEAAQSVGFRIAFLPDPAALEKIRKRGLKQRNANQARPRHATSLSIGARRRALQAQIKVAQGRRWRGKTAAERAEHMRMMARARWARPSKRRAKSRKRST